MVKGACSILHLMAAALWAAMIAIGETGSGKATQLRIVCREACQREDANVVD
jgi:HrpA-like RNA helicase